MLYDCAACCDVSFVAEAIQEHLEDCMCNLSTSLAAMFQQLQAALTFSLVKVRSCDVSEPSLAYFMK